MGDERNKAVGIEMLRLLCAVAVVIWHYQHFYMGADGRFVVDFTRDRQPLWGALEAFYRHGYVAVWVFWLISGHVFFARYHEVIARGGMAAGRFFVLRFSRLYPLHAVTLVLTAGLQAIYAAGHGGDFFVYVDNDLRHFLLNVGFASCWGFERGMSFDGPIWSVSIEVLVYVVFFVLSLRLGRLGLLGRAVVAVAAVAVWAFGGRLGLVPDHWPVATGVFYFYLGGVVEAALREMPANVVRRFAPLAIVAALIFAWATFGSDIRFMAYVDPTGEAKVPKWATPIFGCLLVFGFEGLARHAGVARLFARVMPLADTTYSSYLVHFPIQLAVVTVVDRLGVARTIFDAPAVLVAFLAVVFGSAWVVFHRFERPMQNRLRALSGGAIVPVS